MSDNLTLCHLTLDILYGQLSNAASHRRLCQGQSHVTRDPDELQFKNLNVDCVDGRKPKI